MLRTIFQNGRFSPPATEASVAAVEAILGLRLPDQLRRLYFDCDGFREDRGNAKYLLSLTEVDHVGSLLTTTRFLWNEITLPNLKSFVFFGLSGGDEYWGLNFQIPDEIIAYHHHMQGQYEIIGNDIIEIYQADYQKYEELELPPQ